jgi:hypothetical protein
VIAAALFIIGMLTAFSGLIGEMLKINRMLLEDIQYHLRRDRLPRELREEKTNQSADTRA